MCGLFGVITPDSGIDESRASACLHSMAHRGPDDWGSWCEKNVYIGHRRLSIIDLSDQGRQPLVDDEEGVIVTVNGEIYNYKELKEELCRHFFFKSHLDSEVVLWGYKYWGLEKLLKKLQGMYAFSIFDKKQNKLILARDRMGIKPLYYSYSKGILVWASELKGIEKYLSSQLNVDYTAVYDFLTYRYIPSPKTLYKDVKKLEPGSYIECNLDKKLLKQKRYWKLSLEENKAQWDDNPLACINELLNESINEHMVSDIPVSFLLSGGLDSSLICAMTAANTGKINTYSIAVDSGRFNEEKYSDLVSLYIESSHIKKAFNIADSGDLFSKMRQWYDEPFADFSAMPMFLLSRLVADTGKKVAISGDGADEIFGGYDRYFNHCVTNALERPKEHFLRMIKKCLEKTPYCSLPWRVGRYIGRMGVLTGLELYADLLGALPADRRWVYKEFYAIDKDYDDYWFFRQHYDENLSPLTRLQYLDINTYLPECILTKVDRVSMAASVEVRVPYLSHSLVEKAMAIPDQIKCPDSIGKNILKEIAKNYLPENIIHRKKKGFGISNKHRICSKTGKLIYEQEKILKELFKEIPPLLPI